MIKRSTSLFLLISMVVMLTLVSRVNGQNDPEYGCRLEDEGTRCSTNGECLEDGNCFCNVGYIGQNCETKTDREPQFGSLGKGFQIFWSIFWILVLVGPCIALCALSK